MTIRETLKKLADPAYREFSRRLLPPGEQVIGVRLPLLRRLARKMAREGTPVDFPPEDGAVFEEIMLEGMIIGYSRCSLDERLARIRRFLPRIRNWSVCDSFCAGLKFAREYKPEVWRFLQPYFRSDDEYPLRFACVMLLDYYTDEADLEKDFSVLDTLSDRPYYAMMSAAWAISVLYQHHPRQTMAYLRESHLDARTYNQALQKIMESRRTSPQEREALRAEKRMQKKPHDTA